ncbi:hypothetical protein LPJ55_004410 [Coemansia sp. RSA 990]|nr:hypothetical protein LPJ68_003735 [Coemansia sp. RSA 1086]KAJ1870749.1 hypothetical protein LPJ55_004410 [Coemansia sp. RSA 990]
MAVLSDPSDEGYCFSMQTTPLPSRAAKHAITPASSAPPTMTHKDHAIDSLARALEQSLAPQACAHLALELLAHVPVEMLRHAVQELNQRLRWDFIDKLPLEISLRILQFLPATDIASNVLLVSKRWHAVASQPYLWRQLYRAQGWRFDRQRWELYCSFPRIADASQSLLLRSVSQMADAFSSASSGTLAPAVASLSKLQSLEREFCAGNALLDGGASQSAMDSLATATAAAMSLNAAARASPRLLHHSHVQGDSLGALRLLGIRLPGIGDRSPGPSNRMCGSPQRLAQQLCPLQLAPAQSRQKASSAGHRARRIQAVDWQDMYLQHHCLLENWRKGRCRVDRWEAAHSESIYSLQFGRDNWLYTGSRDNSVRIWHMSETGSQITPLATLQGHTGSVLTLQADESTLITGSSDATVCVWDLDSCTVRHRLQHDDAVLSLRFTDRWLVTASKDRMLHVWRRDQDYAHAFDLAGHAVAINAISLHGDVLVSASGDRTIKLWNLTTRTCVQTLDEHTRGVATLDFDGMYIVSGSSDRSIRIWNARSGKCERTIANAHSDLVRTVMFDRSMDVLVSGSYDETIKVWSFSTGCLLYKFRNVHTSRVFKLMFDRSRIVSCSHDRSVAVIDFAVNLPHARLLL